MMENERDYSWFEQELLKEADAVADFSAAEQRLFERIAQAEELGFLSMLKIDEMPTIEMLQKIEIELFSKISQFKEYEEPVNDCIKSEQSLSTAQWERLEIKLGEKISNTALLPDWEQTIMASQKEPVPGEWEKIERALFSRIDLIKGQDIVEQSAHTDEVPIPAVLEKAEHLLDENIIQKLKLRPWEQVIKSEEIVPYRKWEDLEERLFSEIQIAASRSLSKQPFWFLVDHYVRILKTAGMVSAALILAVAGFWSYQRQYTNIERIPTLVYQLQGSAVNSQDLSSIVGQQFSSAEGGAVTLVNAHGVIELQNGSGIDLSRLSQKEVSYHVQFDQLESGNLARGKVSFLVNPIRPSGQFKVHTPDYKIEVKGTYFRVEPDIAGKVITRVLEGSVKVTSRIFGDTILRAGQSIRFDQASNQYRIHDGGPVIQRKEIESVPEIEVLMSYGIISIQASVGEAEIRIDGKYYGTAPLAIRQPYGRHRIQVGKKGFSTVDTTIQLTKAVPHKNLDIVLEEIVVPAVAAPESTVIPRSLPVKTRKLEKDTAPLSPEQVAQTLLGAETEQAEETYFEAQKAELEGKWRAAIHLYQKVFDDQNSSRLRREDALFSIGKLRAENESDISSAKQVFLTYLALYPGGSFSGESWLRLAELEFRSNPDNAIQYYLKYFEMFPRHPRISELQNRVGVLYLQQKRFDEAAAMFRQALTNLGSSREEERKNISRNLYKALTESGDQQSAQAVWRQYLAKATEK